MAKKSEQKKEDVTSVEVNKYSTKLSKEERIAIMCHQANKTWCELNGDHSQPNWLDAPKWQRESAIASVQYKIDNPKASAARMHNSWLEAKVEAGWKFGKVKDPVKKTHPSMVPYNDLSEVEQKKYAIFSAIVDALR